jgi:hypothetical protein
MGPEAHSCSSRSPPPPHRLTLFGIPRPSFCGRPHPARSNPFCSRYWAMEHSIRWQRPAGVMLCTIQWARGRTLPIQAASPISSFHWTGILGTGRVHEDEHQSKFRHGRCLQREKRSEQITSQEGMLGVMVYDTIPPNQQMAGVMVWENKKLFL